jgi:hypothetical protein
MLLPERHDVTTLPVPTTVQVADTDMADALTAAGWTVYPPDEKPPDGGGPPGGTTLPDAPACGWPGGAWAGGGRVAASDVFAGPGLSPLWGSGIRWQSYAGAPSGYCKQAESQWNVPGVYAPEQLSFDSGLVFNCKYHAPGVKGPPGNDPCYYLSSAICSWPSGYLGVSGPGTAPIGFAWQAGSTDLILQYTAGMPSDLDWAWQGQWCVSSPDWKLEFDIAESIGSPPTRPIQTTSHYSPYGGSAGDAQVSGGPWGTQPQAATSYTYTAILGTDNSLRVYLDGAQVAENRGVNGQSQWMSFVHQFGLAARPRDTHPGWTADAQRMGYFIAWQPNATPVGQGIKGGGAY